jgi:hypothetical protein
MNKFQRLIQKKVHPLIVYPVLALFSFSLVLVAIFFYIRSEAFAQQFLQPFEGTITDIDYVSCVCGLSTLITIEPTLNTTSGQPEQFLFFYGGQVLCDLFGICFEYNGIKLFPRVFAHYLIWYSGPQQLLGTYIPVSLPCVAYAGTSCSIDGYYPAIHNVGTSLY